MSYAQALTAIVLSAATAVAASYLVHRAVRLETRVSHHEVGAAIFLQLGVLFAVLLAFVFNEAYAEYGQAQQAIELECGARHASAMLASALPGAEARDLLGGEVSYIREVVDVEWPQLRAHRRSSEAAALSLTGLMQRAARLPVTDPAAAAVKSQLLALLADVHAQREVRLYQASNGLPGVLWTVLIGFSLVLMVFVAFSGLRRYLSLALFSATFGACVSATLVLVRLLDYPFEGAIGLSPDDFATTMTKVLTLLRAA